MLMRKHCVDMWVVTMREYNEDPVFRALVSPTTFAARRRTIYIFHDRGPEEGVERLALAGTSQGGVYEAVRATVTAPDGRAAELWGSDQWDLFGDMVRERDPERIAVNISHDHNFADGLSAGEWEQMQAALGPELTGRIVREPLLAIEYLAMRVPAMTPVYRKMQTIVHEIIATAFSDVVIVPGQTKTADVVWWMRQRVHDLGLGSWFQPSVSIERRGVGRLGGDAPVIERGDVLHRIEEAEVTLDAEIRWMLEAADGAASGAVGGQREEFGATRQVSGAVPLLNRREGAKPDTRA